MAQEKLYTTGALGEILQVNPSSIAKWVNDGKLVAYTTPGGHRRLRASDVAAYMRSVGMYVPPELTTAKRKVLFVDDHAHLLGAMRRAMKDYSKEIDFMTAQSGVEALVAIGVDRPDVLFLDQAMPGLDGLEVLAQLKSRPETRSIEVVLMSGGLTAALERKAHALGAKAVKAKPISGAEIAELCSIRASA